MDDMAKFPGLVRRNGSDIYLYRVRVPKDLVARIGRTDIWKSLRTRDLALAKERYWEVAARQQREFADHRRRRDLVAHAIPSTQQSQTLSATEAIALSRALVAETFSSADVSDTRLNYDADAADDIAAELDTQLADLQSLNENGELRIFQAITHLLGKYGGEGQPLNRSDPVLKHYVHRALINIAQGERARFSGDFSRRGTDADFENIGMSDLNVKATPDAPLTIREASEIFWRHKFDTLTLSAKTERKYRAALEHVVKYLGGGRPIGTVKRIDCMQFRNVLARLPANFTKRVGKERSLEEAADFADENGLPKMAFETQTTYLNMMLRFVKWAHNEEHIQHIKLGDIEPLATKGRPESKRRSFTVNELQKIFNAPVYTGCFDDEYRFARAGPNIIRRSRYWVPLIALFTGMRLGEILQLTTEHIRKSDAGTDFIVLTPDMRLKTPDSQREVPIHSLLVAFGFLGFVEGKRAKGESELFDDVPLASDGTRSTLFSKRFASFLRSVGIKDVSPGSCFHMFRHTMKDALDRGQVPEEHSDAICGWSRGKKMGRKYGDGKDADTLALWVEKLVLPQVDLTHLKMPHGGVAQS